MTEFEILNEKIARWCKSPFVWLEDARFPREIHGDAEVDYCHDLTALFRDAVPLLDQCDFREWTDKLGRHHAATVRKGDVFRADSWHLADGDSCALALASAIGKMIDAQG